MSHYAKIEDGKVTQVIVAEADFIASRPETETWIQTSYNTRGGKHIQGGTPLRGNYAGIGYSYDSVNDVFLPPTPFSSWPLNTSTWTWEPPAARPTDGKIYYWDEESLSWKEVT